MPGELSLQLPKARILCLHGYGQNADFFRARTGALRKALKSSCDFTFLDGTFEARASFLGDADGERGAALGWWEWEEGGVPRRVWGCWGGLNSKRTTSPQTIQDARARLHCRGGCPQRDRPVRLASSAGAVARSVCESLEMHL